MDRGGRLSGTLNLRQAPEGFATPPSRFAFFIHRLAARTGRWRVIRGIEIVFVAALLAATALYGAIRGGHADAIIDSIPPTRSPSASGFSRRISRSRARAA
jgi:hypothetical protein